MVKRRFGLGSALCLSLLALTLGVPASAQSGSTARSNAGNDADVQALKSYKLTMPKLDQFAAATRAMVAWAKAHPEAKKPEMDDIGDAKTVAEMERKAKAEAPGLVKAIESSGMSFRDYWLTMGSLMQAYMTAEYQRSGAAIPKDVPPENVAFVKANKEKIAAMMAELQKLSREAGDKDDDKDKQ